MVISIEENTLGKVPILERFESLSRDEKLEILLNWAGTVTSYIPDQIAYLEENGVYDRVYGERARYVRDNTAWSLETAYRMIGKRPWEDRPSLPQRGE